MESIKKTPRERGADHEEEQQDSEVKDQRNPTLSEDVDDILEDIDGVLEENAEEFVKNYIQKGGE